VYKIGGKRHFLETIKAKLTQSPLKAYLLLMGQKTLKICGNIANN